MKIADVISGLKTYLTNLSWTSDDGEGTTSFSGVYTFPNYEHDGGYPFAVILDESGSGSSVDNRNVSFDTTITVSICVNYATIDKQTESEQIEEAMLRLREAWDYLKTQLFKYTTMNTLGVDWAYEPGFVDDFNSELNLYMRTITLVVKENISRG